SYLLTIHFVLLPPPTRSTLFPYTTLFRSVMATINQPIDQDTAVLVVEEMGHTPKVLKENQIEEGLQGAQAEAEVAPRPPVVTVIDRKSTRLNSSHQIISYAVFCLKKKNKN